MVWSLIFQVGESNAKERVCRFQIFKCLQISLMFHHHYADLATQRERQLTAHTKGKACRKD